MPARTLPTISLKEVQTHADIKSCYVTIDNNVYDVTSFLDDHPGGGELILQYGGKDIKHIMKDAISHTHSESAYDILDDSLIGFVANEKTTTTSTRASQSDQDALIPATSVGIEVIADKAGAEAGDARSELEATKMIFAATGMSDETDLSKETDALADYKTHKFLDLNRPLLPQLWNGGFSKQFYLEQVHRPRHYRGGGSAPLMPYAFLEPFSKTAWWVVPLVWLPPVTYGSYLGLIHIDPLPTATFYWAFGLFLWSLVEYILHRFLFHIEMALPDNRFSICAHFLLHGIHHYVPMDRYRLVMPPALFLVLAMPFYKLVHMAFYWDWYVAIMVWSGGIFGYICYDLTHYFLHHKQLPAYWRSLKKYHLQHHFADFESGFGVTSRFWDWIFNTQLEYVKQAAPIRAA